MGLALTGVLVQFSIGPEDNPEDYENKSVSKTIRQIVENEYIHFGSDGSALYALPKIENLKFSNAGKEHLSKPPENKKSYLEGLNSENASYILIYGDSNEENVIHQLKFPLVYQKENIKIYKVTTTTKP